MANCAARVRGSAAQRGGMPPLGWRKNKDGKQPSKKPGGKKLGRPPKRKQLDSDDDEEDYGSMGLGVNKKQMKRNRRPKPDQDARIKAALAAARFDEGDLGEAPLAPPPPLEDEQVGNDEGEGKGKAAEKDTVVEDEDEDDKGGKGEGEGASSEEDDEAEVDAADEEALAEGRAAGVEFSKELYESLTKEQLARYELYRRSALGRSGVRKVMQSVLMGNVAHQPTIGEQAAMAATQKQPGPEQGELGVCCVLSVWGGRWLRSTRNAESKGKPAAAHTLLGGFLQTCNLAEVSLDRTVHHASSLTLGGAELRTDWSSLTPFSHVLDLSDVGPRKDAGGRADRARAHGERADGTCRPRAAGTHP